MSQSLVLTQSMLDSAKDMRAVFDLEPFQNNFVKNFIKTTGGTSEGALMKFEREKIAFLKAFDNNKELAKCTRFSVYSAFIELGYSGQSLEEGEAYIIPYKDKAQFQIGYKGRVNQINTLPNVTMAHQPKVVYDCDEFEYELGEHPRITVHKPGKKVDGSYITHVYMLIDMEPIAGRAGNKELFIMDRDEVLSIRDRYSKGYKLYVQKCQETKTPIGQPVTVQGQYGPYTIDMPMWVTSEAEAWKKTIVKRAYKWMPKTAHMRILDTKIATTMDPEDGTQTDDIEYSIMPDAEAGGAPTPDALKTKTTRTRVKPDTTPAATAQPVQQTNAPSAAADIHDIAGASEGTGEVQEAQVVNDGIDNPLDAY